MCGNLVQLSGVVDLLQATGDDDVVVEIQQTTYFGEQRSHEKPSHTCMTAVVETTM